MSMDAMLIQICGCTTQLMQKNHLHPFMMITFTACAMMPLRQNLVWICTTASTIVIGCAYTSIKKITLPDDALLKFL